MRIGVAEARAGTPRSSQAGVRFPKPRGRAARCPLGPSIGPRNVPRSARSRMTPRRPPPGAPASFSGDRLEVSDDASLLARLETVTARVFDAVSPDVDALVPERRPPRLSRLVRVVGAVPEIDWAEATRTEARFADLARTFAGYEGHARAPVILRGAADAWPCVSDPQKRWTLANLTAPRRIAGETRVRERRPSRAMRLAASEFQYVEANHPAVRAGTFQSPSTVRGMTVSEVAARMTARDGDDSAGAYMQAELRGGLDSRSRDDFKPGRSSRATERLERLERQNILLVPVRRRGLARDAAAASVAEPGGLDVLAALRLERLGARAGARAGACSCTRPPRWRAPLYPDWHPLRRRSAVRLDADFANGDATAANEAFPRWAGEEGRRRDDRRTDKRSGDVGADAATTPRAGKPAGKNDTKK